MDGLILNDETYSDSRSDRDVRQTGNCRGGVMIRWLLLLLLLLTMIVLSIFRQGGSIDIGIDQNGYLTVVVGRMRQERGLDNVDNIEMMKF